MIALIGRSIGRTVRPLTAIGLVLCAFQLALIAAASSIASDGNVGGLARLVPGFLQQSLGLALLSFAGMTTIGYFDAIIVMIVVLSAIHLAAEPAGDVEAGLVDLILARPLPRAWIVTRSLSVMMASVAALVLIMSAALWAGLAWLVPNHANWPEPRIIAKMSAHLMLVAWCFGAWSLAASAWARRRGTAIAVIAIVGVALYLLDLVATIWKPVAGIARLSPFHYFHGGEILAGTASTTQDVAVLASITLAGFAIAYWRFGKRDL
jgi:beta-exotoxin I transport system permease protein